MVNTIGISNEEVAQTVTEQRGNTQRVSRVDHDDSTSSGDIDYV